MLSRRLIKNNPDQRGFTIVELMIALTVLSTLLVVASVVMLSIGKLYTKGVNAANLQSTTRNVVSDVASLIQFSSDKPSGCTHDLDKCYMSSKPYSGTNKPELGNMIYAYCVGTTRYSFTINRKLGDDQRFSPAVSTPHVLWRDTMTNTGSCDPMDISSSNPGDPHPGTSLSPNPTKGGYEMMSEHTRLTAFRVVHNTVADNYQIDIKTAYGDSDLLNLPPADGSTDGTATCKGGQGSQFCSLADISTTVILRAEAQ
jgi:prepilin-type N-terminal cleavage/methylation domain-containing protein